jgi:PAS domain S-box-containing protein
MLQARGGHTARRVVGIKGPRSSVSQLAFIFVSTLAVMILYEVAKSLVFPAITLWESHLITIVLAAIVATTGASWVLRKLRHGEDSYRRLVEMSPDAAWIHRQGTIIIANSACATMLGFPSPKSLLGKQVLDFICSEDRDAVRERIQNQFDDPNPVQYYETKHVRLDGMEMEVEVVVCSILYQEEAASLAMFHDLSERRRAEQRLRESEANLAASQRIAHLGSWALELDQLDELDKNPLRWSDELYRIFGYEVGQLEVSRPNFLRAIHPADRDRMRDAMAKALPNRTGYSAECRMIRADGAERIIQVHADIILDKKTQKPLRFVGTVQDITEQKHAEEKLAQLALIVESSDDAITSVALDWTVTSWNKGAERIYGYSASEMAGRPITILAPPDSADEMQLIQERLRRGERIEGFETVRIRKDGKPIDVSLTISPVMNPAGKIVGTAAIARNITAHKREEERFYKAFHLNPEPITLATVSEGRYLDVNESFLRITGYQREEVIGRTSLEVKFWERPEDRARLIEMLQEQGSVRDLEIAFRTKSDEQRIALDSADIIEVDGQKCIIAILKDITERKGLEKQLRQMQKMEAIGQLSGGIAHDFNNLLGVILGYAELLEEGLGRNIKLQKTAQEIKKAGLRAASLTRQLLAFSRQQVLEPRVLNLNTVAADTEKMLRRLIGEHIEMTSTLAKDLGQVKADQGQIEQVIMNLAVNARDAMPDGGKLIIETKNVELDAEYSVRHPPTLPGRYVQLAMTDTGVGMDAQTLSHIFEPFFTTKDPGKGTGLGLATVYGVVKQSGGYIWVYSEPGLGTTFKVYLPRVDASAPRNGSRVDASASARGSETILLVEDEESLRTLTRTMLEQNGYTVLAAGGGKEAIEIAQNCGRPIDLLLTDMVMPGMDGHAVARTLGLICPGIKVIYMSGYSGFGHRGIASSADILLSKPLTREAMLRKLHEVLHLQNDHVGTPSSPR